MSSLRMSLNDLLEYPVLTAAKQNELFQNLVQARASGDATAVTDLTETIAKHNLRLVASVCKRLRPLARRINPSTTMDDMMQEGNMGLMRSIEDFDHRKGLRFSTYATPWIETYVRRGIYNSSPIRVPVNAHEHMSKRYVAETRGETVEWSKRRETRIEQAESVLNVLSLQTSTRTGHEIGSIIPDTRDDFSAIFRRESVSLVRDLVARVGLNDRDYQVLAMRYGLDGYEIHTFREIGKVLGISHERASQVTKKALAELRHLAQECELDAFLTAA